MSNSKPLRHLTCLAILLLPALANASATRITNYTDLATALKNGHRINTVIDLKKCSNLGTAQHAEGLQDISGIGFNFTNSFFMFAKDDKNRNLVTAITNNTMTSTGDDSAQRYKRVIIYDDNTAYVYGAMANYTSGKIMAVDQYSCAVSKGNDNNAVAIFDYDA